MALIEVNNLRKEFKRIIPKTGFLSGIRNLWNTDYHTHVAVDDISFQVEEGELLGYIGPNGAGKSTSIKMLTGILVPTSGDVKIAGLTPWKDRRQHTQNIGVVFGQKTQLWWDIPVIESFRVLKTIYKIPDDLYTKNLNQFRDLLELDQFENTPVRQLSLGQRMRADLAAALLHDPKILFLDEPTIGVDVLAKERLRTFIKEINRTRGVTVLLTTHDMQDIEKLCHRMAIIDDGNILYDGSIDALKSKFGNERTLVIELDDAPYRLNLPGTRVLREEGPRVWLAFNRDQFSASDIMMRVAEHHTIRDLTVEEPEIESIVREIYEGSHGRKREDEHVPVLDLQ
ncbi:ATP-binding cassette domain-containing protein [Tumebacillus sp. ITR2]|uniref:ATP-binding cassette domain-containing protein n=1 Tax=Tumebacillus amylolyticus TaxID=2801339 RepID=A0ABS1JEY3_9BACL|nr:ATP-binding cassette domain-containing protein [Tumebacillus amylolyticus]MBL0388812.1 ATP-binding cassette domain-containing protein [Tumebacillus amylolyticus]